MVTSPLVQLIDIEKIVPPVYRRWRPLVRDAMAFLFAHLSDGRLASKIAEQMQLPANARTEVRLLRLISKMPGLQKIGQVLARNRHLSAPVRRELSKLENGIADVSAEQILTVIEGQLGSRLNKYDVDIEPAIFSEASVSAVVRFTWRNPESGTRERGVFKVLKPHVPEFFAEDMSLLKKLGVFLTSKHRGYQFAVRDIAEVIDEARLLLENELHFVREQKMLLQAARIYKYTFGVRVPRLIKPLCTAVITAMTEERGVKVTEAFRKSPLRRARIAEQLVGAILSTPLLSSAEQVIFHADPHAGNLLYDEKRRELVILDWALAQPLNRRMRRLIAMFAIMIALRNGEKARQALVQLSARRGRLPAEEARRISGWIERFLRELPAGKQPTGLEIMHLLDRMALDGVRFPMALAMFRKVVFTLDGVLNDVAGPGVRLDAIIARDYITRWLASYGTSLAPLSIGDWMLIQASALRFGARALLAA
jgi:ubiquinone biosynthesis protein